MLAGKKFKLAIVVSHPIEFHVPIYRKLAENPEIDLMVYYCSDWGTRESFDPAFGRPIKWDIPMLEGYKYKFLKSYGVGKEFGFFGQINPGIIKELIVGNYDAVNIFGYVFVTNWLAFLVCRFKKIPIIFRGEADLSKSISSFKKILKKTILENLFKRIDAFLYSYNLNKNFYMFYGVPERKLFFHPCSVDNDFFQKNAESLRGKQEEIKNSIGIKKTEVPIILFSGTLISRKRPMDLLRAYKSVSQKANLIIMGDGKERKELEEFVKYNELNNVYFIGFKNQSEISMFHFVSDIFVLPSEYDPSPKVLNEALNFGHPIITTDRVGTAPELIQEGRNGFIFKVGDVEGLADYLEQLIDDIDLRKKFGIESLKIVNNWSIERDVQGWLEALKYVCKK